MIDFLCGSIQDINDKGIVLSVAGIGFMINCSAHTIDELGSLEHDVKVYTYLSVSENGIALYGFSSKEEREVFLKLIGVSKVGPRVALNILSCFTSQQLIAAVVSSDIKALTRANGVGKKMAESIVFALKDTFGNEDIYVIANASELPNDARAEAVMALNALGFDSSYSSMLVSAVYNPELSCEEIIKEALKISSK